MRILGLCGHQEIYVIMELKDFIVLCNNLQGTISFYCPIRSKMCLLVEIKKGRTMVSTNQSIFYTSTFCWPLSEFWYILFFFTLARKIVISNSVRLGSANCKQVHGCAEWDQCWEALMKDQKNIFKEKRIWNETPRCFPLFILTNTDLLWLATFF